MSDIQTLAPSLGAARPARQPILTSIRAALATRRERLALAKLDGRLLEDIGVCAKSAWAEQNRPFWAVADRHNR